MQSTQNYREYAPPTALADRIVCLWEHRVDTRNAGFVQPVLPDACLDILWRNDAAPVLVGAMSRVQSAALSTDLVIRGLRLAPGQAGILFKVDAQELTDREVRLTDLSATLRTLVHRHRLPDDPGWLNLIADRPADPLMLYASRWLARHPAGRLHQLANQLDLSERQLHRRFLHSAGLSPKRFQRILRFQNLLQHMATAANSRATLCDLALAAGYADQAHMNRDCRKLADRTPQQLLADAHPALCMSDLFKKEQP